MFRSLLVLLLVLSFSEASFLLKLNYTMRFPGAPPRPAKVSPAKFLSDLTKTNGSSVIHTYRLEGDVSVVEIEKNGEKFELFIRRKVGMIDNGATRDIVGMHIVCDSDYFGPKCVEFCEIRIARIIGTRCNQYGEAACHAGICGPQCENDFAECNIQCQCLNGGVCYSRYCPIQNIEKADCECPPGFKGKRCEHMYYSQKAWMNGQRGQAVLMVLALVLMLW